MDQVFDTPDAVVAAIKARHPTCAPIKKKPSSHVMGKAPRYWPASMLKNPEEIDWGEKDERVGWWQSLSVDEKKAAVKPLLEKGMSSTKISNHLQIGSRHRVESVLRRMCLMGDAEQQPRVPAPKPEVTRVAWWRSLTAEQKKLVVRPLLEKGMTPTEISRHLQLGERGCIVGIRDRMKRSGQLPGDVGVRRNKIPLPARTMWSLDAPVSRNGTRTTWHELQGAEDSAFAKLETRQLLQKIHDTGKLAADIMEMVKRLIAGDDLESDEYERLGLAIRQHPGLMKVLEHL